MTECDSVNYSGHVPGYAWRSVGATYGRATQQAMKEVSVLKTILNPIRPQEYREKQKNAKNDDINEEDEQDLKHLNKKQCHVTSLKGSKMDERVQGRGDDSTVAKKSQSLTDLRGSSVSSCLGYYCRGSEMLGYIQELPKKTDSRETSGRVAEDVSTAKMYYSYKYDECYSVLKWFSDIPTSNDMNDSKGEQKTAQADIKSGKTRSKARSWEDCDILDYLGVISGVGKAIEESLAHFKSSRKSFVRRTLPQ